MSIYFMAGFVSSKNKNKRVLVLLRVNHILELKELKGSDKGFGGY